MGGGVPGSKGRASDGGAASVSAVDRYYDCALRLAQGYGTDVWYLLYQCDMRMRLEEMPSMRLDILDEVEEIKRAGGMNPYDSSRPWHLAWQRATGEKSD